VAALGVFPCIPRNTQDFGNKHKYIYKYINTYIYTRCKYGPNSPKPNRKQQLSAHQSKNKLASRIGFPGCRLPLSRSQFASHIRTNLVESWSRGCRTNSQRREQGHGGTPAPRRIPLYRRPFPSFPCPAALRERSGRATSATCAAAPSPSVLAPESRAGERRGRQAETGGRWRAVLAASPALRRLRHPATASRSFFSIRRQCIHTFTATGTSA